jgi:hypothetical protein
MNKLVKRLLGATTTTFFKFCRTSYSSIYMGLCLRIHLKTGLYAKSLDNLLQFDLKQVQFDAYHQLIFEFAKSDL